MTDWTEFDWTKFRPLRHPEHGPRLVLEMDEDHHMTPGGIYIGAASVERNDVLWGTVKAVGKGCELKIGERTCVDRGHACKVLNERKPELILVYEKECYAQGEPGAEVKQTWEPQARTEDNWR